MLAWRNWLEGTTLNIVDSTMPIVSNAEVLRCINIALLCIQEHMTHRPLMSSVVLMLNNAVALPVPSRPAFSLDEEDNLVQSYSKESTTVSDVQVLDNSANEVSISELVAR
ncbi:Cysteine-rich receptor-like protein kinase 28 [Bienertia sinuspersici]